MLSLQEFRRLGREQRHSKANALLRAFISLWGPVGLHSRIRAGHMLCEIKQLSLSPAAHILDAGCGHALVLFALARHYYPEATLHGIEVDAELVMQDAAIANTLELGTALTFEQDDLATCALGSSVYDLIINVDVLEHIEDDVRILRAFHAALKPGGRLLLHVPLRHQQQRRIFPAFKSHVVEDHVRDEYLPEEIKSKVVDAGFEIVGFRYGFGWQGELAFELNSLFWKIPPLRALSALLTYPVAWYLAYRDINATPEAGNSMIVLARAV